MSTELAIDAVGKETEYDRQAMAFLGKYGIKLFILNGTYKEPSWEGPHGDQYRIKLTKVNGKQISFDFWGSVDMQRKEERPTYYDILSTLSADSSSPTDPDDVVEEFDTMKPSQALRIALFATRLQEFFTNGELEDLRQIQ